MTYWFTDDDAKAVDLLAALEKVGAVTSKRLGPGDWFMTEPAGELRRRGQPVSPSRAGVMLKDEIPYVMDLLTDPGYRRQGYGREIMKAIIDKHGKRDLGLYARPDPGTVDPGDLLTFYKSLGFEPSADPRLKAIASQYHSEIPPDAVQMMRKAAMCSNVDTTVVNAHYNVHNVKSAARAGTPGIPDPWRFGDPRKLKPGELVPYVVQRHLAARSGQHYDVRFGKDRMFSFATRKELPEPGKRISVFQTPLHAEAYKHFTGTLPKGTYGAGRVFRHDLGEILILDANPNKIKFVVAHKQHPQEFTLVRMRGKPEPTGSVRKGRTTGDAWLMINSTPREAVPHKKVRYTKIPAEDIDKLFDPGYVMSEKIDGAAAFVRLMKDKIHVLSYRGQKGGAPIVHTYRMGLGGKKIKVPPELRGRVLRGEIWGERGGRAIPPQELGGLLNAAVAKSLRKQLATGTKLRMALFGAPDGERTYQETQKIIDDALQFLPKEIFHKPLHAYTPEEKRKLFEDIRTGKNPRTVEGVVGAPAAGGRPAKVKFLDERDVWIREIVPGGGRLKGTGAGAFRYSLSPTGPVVGEVGTGLADALRRDMWKNPDQFLGRVARVRSQGAFPSGALRAPALLALHEDYPLAKAAMGPTARALLKLRQPLRRMAVAVVKPGVKRAPWLGPAAEALTARSLGKTVIPQQVKTRVLSDFMTKPWALGQSKYPWIALKEGVDPAVRRHELWHALASSAAHRPELISQLPATMRAAARLERAVAAPAIKRSPLRQVLAGALKHIHETGGHAAQSRGGISSDVLHYWFDPRWGAAAKNPANAGVAAPAYLLIKKLIDTIRGGAARLGELSSEPAMKKNALWSMPLPSTPPDIEKQLRKGPYSFYGKMTPAVGRRPYSPYAPVWSPYPSTTISKLIRSGTGGPGSFVQEATGNRWLGMLTDLAAFRDPERVAQTVEYIQGSPDIRTQVEASIPKNLKGEARMAALRKAYINYMLPSLLMPLIPVNRFSQQALGGYR